MKKNARPIAAVLSIVLGITSCGINAFAESAESQRILQAKRQAVLKEFSWLNIVRMSDLDPDDPNFWLECVDENKPVIPGYGEENMPDPYYIPDSEKLSIPSTSFSPYAVSSTTYDVYTFAGNVKQSGIKSLFAAINAASGRNEYVKEADTGTIVFKRDNREDTYYRYQFTNYYGESWATAKTPETWISEYRYAHVVNGKGKLIGNSYHLIDGIAPPTYALENESGSYYYKISNYWSSDSSSTNVDLSGTRYKFSSSVSNNLYIFSAIQNSSGTVELGMLSSKSNGGKWYAYSRDNTSTDPSGMTVYKNHVVATANVSSSGVYSFANNTNLEIKLSLTDTNGVISGSIGGTGYTLYGSDFSVNSGSVFIHAISAPEARTSLDIVPDLRCEAYFENVKFSNCRLYSGTMYSGTVYPFYPTNAEIINTAFLYCDDTITYSKTGNETENISINYSFGYTQ